VGRDHAASIFTLQMEASSSSKNDGTLLHHYMVSQPRELQFESLPRKLAILIILLWIATGLSIHPNQNNIHGSCLPVVENLFFSNKNLKV
jgi:hypothetical protein